MERKLGLIRGPGVVYARWRMAHHESWDKGC